MVMSLLSSSWGAWIETKSKNFAGEITDLNGDVTPPMGSVD